MEIRLIIDGNEIEMTPEQIKVLTKKESVLSPPFARVKDGESFFSITNSFEATEQTEIYNTDIEELFHCGNYCTDEGILEQHALHLKLNNLLWRFSMQHGGDEVKFGFDGADKEVFFIAFDGICNEVSATCWSDRIAGVIYFKDRETAETAITEVVEPFLAKNPGFDWRKM